MAICKCVYATVSGTSRGARHFPVYAIANRSRLIPGSDNAEIMDSSHALRSDIWAGPPGKTKAGQRY
jgi:hypothetical protein